LRDEIERFVASLAIPGDRRRSWRRKSPISGVCDRRPPCSKAATVEAAAARRPATSRRCRRSLEAIRARVPGLALRAARRGALAGLVVRDRRRPVGTVAFGSVATLAALALALALAPPRVFELLPRRAPGAARARPRVARRSDSDRR